MAFTTSRPTYETVEDGCPHASLAAGRALLVVASVVLGAWTLHNVLLLPWENQHLDAEVRSKLLILLRALVWFVPILLYLKRHDPRPASEALGVTTRIDPRGLLLGVIPALLYLGVSAGLQSAVAPRETGPRSLGGTLLRRERSTCSSSWRWRS